MSQLSLTSKSSTPSFTNKQSDISSTSLGEEKDPAAKSQRYENTLRSAGIWMGLPELPTTKTCCQTMLDVEQPIPKDSLFGDDLFETTCENIRNRNKARVIQDVARLIVPSAETLTTYGATHLKHLIENVNEGWIKSIPLVNGPRPQPDFSVGLRRTAFTSDQLKKLKLFVGDWKTASRVMATDKMYFPFLTSDNEALNIADRLNAHSASVAANAMVEIYRAVSRQDELHQKILTFSVSHDHSAVGIYGHYVLINGKDTSFHRHRIRNFDITNQNGEDRWTSYKFIRNVYNIFAPIHLERICAAVNDFPDPEVFLVEPLSQQSNADFFEEDDSQSIPSHSQGSPPRVPSSPTTEPVFKKPKGKISRE
ncbi:MAG: hypothetical protein LQ347_005163 [Umbilicaria vellea]|nr:MAG: hypothetical protein LQ347_005163 [Umbilicaria vellea]